MRFTMLLALCLSSLTFASQPKQLNMPVGTTTTLSMPATVSSVTVSDPSMVEVSRSGRRVVLMGRSTGTTEVTVKTADGETHLKIYVAADKYGLPH
jgi:Flp pilus assembly secretin CpaC